MRKLLKYANNLFDLVSFTDRQVFNLCDFFLSYISWQERTRKHEKRRKGAYIWSGVDKKNVETTIDYAESTLDRVQNLIDELKHVKSQIMKKLNFYCS